MPHYQELEIDSQPEITYIVDPDLEGLREYEPQVHRAIDTLIEKHTREGARFEPLPYAPDEFPAERLDVVELRHKNPGSIYQLGKLASLVYPNFPALAHQYKSRPYRRSMQTLLNGMYDGENYILAFDHGDVANTAVGGAAILDAIEATAARMDRIMPEHYRRIMVSKIMSRMKILGLPVVELIATAGVVDMSLPPTLTMLSSGIDSKIRKPVNDSVQNVRRGFEAVYARTAILDFMSPSGSADIEAIRFFGLHRQKPHVHMAPISYGTAEEFEHASGIIPVCAYINQSKPKAAMGEIMGPIRGLTHAQEVMMRLGDLGTEATGTPHTFHITREEYEAAIKGLRQR